MEDSRYGSRKFIVALAVLGIASGFTAWAMWSHVGSTAEAVSLLGTWGLTAGAVLGLYGIANVASKKVAGGEP